MEKKKWYQSKIVLLGLTLGIVGGSQLAFGWLGGQVTPEQLQSIETAQPALFEGLKKSINGGNYLGIITTIGGFLTATWRVWFTTKSIG